MGLFYVSHLGIQAGGAETHSRGRMMNRNMQCPFGPRLRTQTLPLLPKCHMAKQYRIELNINVNVWGDDLPNNNEIYYQHGKRRKTVVYAVHTERPEAASLRPWILSLRRRSRKMIFLCGPEDVKMTQHNARTLPAPTGVGIISGALP